MKIQFCPYCGGRLDEVCKFCKHCGKDITDFVSEDQEIGNQEEKSDGNSQKREVVYDGKVHKCPNCGEVLESFAAVCPACGCEIRGVEASSSVREFAEKLGTISAKGANGGNFGYGGEPPEQFERHLNEEKASLIINFSVPNTKEDIMEFMMLADSNINTKKRIKRDDVVTKAWITKMEQVYKKAEMLMEGTEDLEEIKAIYVNKKNEIRNKRFKIYLFWTALVEASFILSDIYAGRVSELTIVLLIIFVAVGIYIYNKK